MMPDLIEIGNFTLHSGEHSSWRINADALTDAQLDSLARWFASTHRYHRAIGVPRGGIRFAEALQRYRADDGPLLIVDDVLTTGASMEDARRDQSMLNGTLGVVIFARGPVPDWVTPLFVVAG